MKRKSEYPKGKNPASAHGLSTGRPPDLGEKKVPLNITVTPSTKAKLKALAEQQNCSISEFIEKLVQETIDPLYLMRI